MKTLLTTLCLTATLAAPVSADMKQIPVVRLESSIDVAASPQAVWTFLTTGKNYATWCPEWQATSNAKVNLKKVGDVLDFTDEWGNGGRSVVTFYSAGKELRVSHEPDNGSYVCQARVVLTPSGNMTNVKFIEQYTDESSADDLSATAAKVEAGMKETLANVKKAVEKK
jgi:uncharacterized protein YndB with AHSA1/START domain